MEYEPSFVVHVLSFVWSCYDWQHNKVKDVEEMVFII